ncbi:MAG: diguanylate cyclase, partial [Ruminococcus sp.]|nr:diguanylate cyclase [Ruminococcus sp.]
MEFLRSIQSDLMLFLSGVCAALSILVLISDSIPPKRRWSLLVMELVSMILLISDRYAYIFRGDDSDVGYIMVRLCNFVVFFASIFEIFGFNLYLKNMFTDDGKTGEYPRALRIVDVILVTAAAMLIVSQYTGFYYTFDEHNYYHRESGMIVCYMMPLLALMIQLVVIIKRRRS